MGERGYGGRDYRRNRSEESSGNWRNYEDDEYDWRYGSRRSPSRGSWGGEYERDAGWNRRTFDEDRYGPNYYGQDYYGRRSPGYYGRSTSSDYDYERGSGRGGRRRQGSEYERGYGRGEYGGSGDWRERNVPYTSTSYWFYWSTPGPETGRGPEGYQRSNERITEDVNERLTQHGRVNASKIQVEANNGIVTLRGSVNSRQAKRMAEEAAESVSGVRDVQNQLQVEADENQGNKNQGDNGRGQTERMSRQNQE
jgi:hypothetical protein